MGVGCTLGRLSSAGADELVTCQVIFAKADGATMKGTKVPMQPLADILGSLGKHLELEDVRVVCVVVGLLNFFYGENMCR